MWVSLAHEFDLRDDCCELHSILEGDGVQALLESVVNHHHVQAPFVGARHHQMETVRRPAHIIDVVTDFHAVFLHWRLPAGKTN